MKGKSILQMIISFVFIVMLSTSPVLATTYCNGNFDEDKDVDGSDASTFKSDFGRSGLQNPCPSKSVWNIFYPGTDEVIDWVDHAPNPRFAVYDVYGNNGTADSNRYEEDAVLDKDTGLIWPRNASMGGTAMTWLEAMSHCRQHAICFSHIKGWRLPTQEELASLVDPTQTGPALPPGHPFIYVHLESYWTSTTDETDSSIAWHVHFQYGAIWKSYKNATNYVWPVLGGNGIASGNWEAGEDGCPYGMVDCGDKCVDPLTDREHCGADINCSGGTVCGAGQICTGGVCVLSCQSGLTNCSGMCVDTQTNENHCGGCNSPCGSGEICIAGSCDIYYPDNYAPVPKTGQTTTYATADDGDLEKGVPWPNPRFTDNGDGTVTDNLTGLIWVKNAAGCFLSSTWTEALLNCLGLNTGECGLTDGSSAGDWRLPNRFELESLLDLGNQAPSLPTGHPFTNTTAPFWSSTSWQYGPADYAWCVYMGDGDVDYWPKSGSTLRFAWPVRGGQ